MSFTDSRDPWDSSPSNHHLREYFLVVFSPSIEQAKIQVFVGGGVNGNGITYQGLRWDSYSFCLSFVLCFLLGSSICRLTCPELSFRTDQGVSWMNSVFFGVCHSGFDGQMMEEGKKKRKRRKRMRMMMMMMMMMNITSTMNLITILLLNAW